MASPSDPITPEDEARVRKHAARILREAGATGRFPTPIDDILRVAKLRVERESLDEGFLRRMYRGVASGIKRALGKIRALLHAGERVIVVARDEHEARLPWIKAHEAGHSYMPHQRDMYLVTEDCEQSLEPSVTEQFEHEANIFAGEVLFQGDSLRRDAQDLPFGIMSAVKLQKKYGSSIYACVRRYVSTNARACAVIVTENEKLDPALGVIWPFRRIVASSRFITEFGIPDLPEFFTVGDGPVGELLPRSKSQRHMRPRQFAWRDRNGAPQEVVAEAFYSGRNVFVLVLATKSLARAVLVP